MNVKVNDECSTSGFRPNCFCKACGIETAFTNWERFCTQEKGLIKINPLWSQNEHTFWDRPAQAVGERRTGQMDCHPYRCSSNTVFLWLKVLVVYHPNRTHIITVLDKSRRFLEKAIFPQTVLGWEWESWRVIQVFLLLYWLINQGLKVGWSTPIG